MTIYIEDLPEGSRRICGLCSRKAVSKATTDLKRHNSVKEVCLCERHRKEMMDQKVDVRPSPEGRIRVKSW